MFKKRASAIASSYQVALGVMASQLGNPSSCILYMFIRRASESTVLYVLRSLDRQLIPLRHTRTINPQFVHQTQGSSNKSSPFLYFQLAPFYPSIIVIQLEMIIFREFAMFYLLGLFRANLKKAELRGFSLEVSDGSPY